MLSKFSWGTKPTKADPEKELIMSCIEKKTCKACTPLDDVQCKNKECSKPSEDNTQECPALKCDGDSYTMDGKVNHVSSKDFVKCQLNITGKPGWHIFHKDPPVEVTKLSCRSFLACPPNVETKCPSDKVCKGPTVNGTVLECSDGMKIYSGTNPANPTCDTKTGKWKGIDGGVYCKDDSKSEKKTDDPKTGSTGLIVGIIFGVIAVLAIAGVAVYIFVIRPKMQAAKKIALPSKGPPSKKGEGKSAEGGSKSKKDKKASSSDPAPDSSKKPSASGKEGSADPATPAAADANKPPPSTDIEKLADKNSDPKNPPTPAADAA
ncbi:hypothetical protein PMAYCL1PPCAC_18759, partial [Pristionchus mayeri]